MESHMGYRFQPSDELIVRLLKEKRLDPNFSHHPIKDINHICSLEPWDLPTASKTESEDQVCYFFYEPHYKYRNSNRVHRRTEAGQWKITSKVSQIEAGNGLTGTKKFLTFYCCDPDSKAPVKTDWVMHEYRVKDDPRYQKEFVLCRIQRKRNKKRKGGISTTDEGESSQQLVSPPQQSPSDHSISNGIRNEENTHTIPQQQPQNHNSVYYPVNPTVQNTIYPQSITNDTPAQLSLSNHMISGRNHSDENIPTNQPLPQNHSEESTLKNPQQLSNHNSISYLGNRGEQIMCSLTYPWLIPNYSPTQLPLDRFISAINDSEKNNPRNPLLPPNSNLELQLPLYHPSVIHNFAKNNFQEDLPIGEFNAYGSYNWRNDAFVSAIQSPISQEQELTYSNSCFDKCYFPDCQTDSEEQVNYPIHSQRAFQDVNSRKETGQTLIPDFDPSKSDGEASAYAEDSSDTNTADDDAWVKELLLKKDECLRIGEFKLDGGNNRLNDASFSAVQTPISQEQELVYSISSVDNCDFSYSQIYSDEQVNYLINSPRAFPDETPRVETGQTLTTDSDSSKSDGEASACAKDSSDTNAAYNYAWIKEPLENFA